MLLIRWFFNDSDCSMVFHPLQRRLVKNPFDSPSPNNPCVMWVFSCNKNATSIKPLSNVVVISLLHITDFRLFVQRYGFLKCEILI